MENWTFLTNYGHVLLCIASDPQIRLRELAVRVGITERSAQRIVATLVEGGYLQQTRVGRCNHYQIQRHLHLRHPVERESQVGSLLSLIRRRQRAPKQARVLAARP
jgi:DNA-binding IclR family transcriptional regulator